MRSQTRLTAPNRGYARLNFPNLRSPATATCHLPAKEGPLKMPGKPEIREYKAMFVLGDEEIGIFSHELVVNCAP